jgi:hypothetical protein
METQTIPNQDEVQAAMNYLAEPEQKPVSYMYKPPEGTQQRSWHVSKYPMAIRNARAVVDELSLDREGFVLTHQNSAIKNFYDDAEVRSVYYPEVERLVKEATGAARVLVFDHNVRRGTSAGPAEKGVREPVKYAHNDYTVKSGPQRVRDLLPADEAEALLKNRFAVINVWRPIRGPVEEMPLAVCDARTIASKDLVPTDLRYPDRTGEVYSLAFNPEHRWFYFPRMRTDEVMLLKCYDSLDDGRARFTAHSAFDDPTTQPGAAARESIEVRTLAFFTPIP